MIELWQIENPKSNFFKNKIFQTVYNSKCMPLFLSPLDIEQKAIKTPLLLILIKPYYISKFIVKSSTLYLIKKIIFLPKIASINISSKNIAGLSLWQLMHNNV